MTLWNKAITFLVALLAGEVLLLGLMAFLLYQSQAQAAEAERTRAIVLDALLALESVLDSGKALGLYGIKRDVSSQKLFVDSVEQLKGGGGTLQELEKRVPEGRDLFASMKSDSDEMVALLQTVKKAMDDGFGPFGSSSYSLSSLVSRAIQPDPSSKDVRLEQPPAYAQEIERFRRIPKLMRRMNEHLVDLVKIREHIDSTQQAETTRSILKGVMVVAALLNAFGCYILVDAFTKNISDRLQTLRSNTELLVNDSPLHPLVTGNDEITELDKFFHRMAAILTAATERDKIILTNMPSGTITFSKEMCIQFVNPTFEKMSGFHSSELVGQQFGSIFFAPSLDVRTAQDVQSLFGKVTQVQLLRMNEGPLSAEISLSSYSDSNREIYVCSVMDVSDRHEVERLKQEFVDVISHDLRTPLANIADVLRLMHADALGELNAKGKGLVERTLNECSRLLELVSDLLTVSKVEAGKLVLAFEDCSISKVLDRSIAAIKAVADERELNIVLDVPDLSIEANEARLVQVFVNLLANAIKYSPRSGTITVVAKVARDTLRISVADQGCGIPKEAQRRIFERFAQVRASDDAKGSGLGLTICKLIVEAHHGQLGVNSEENKGSEFWVELPRSQKLMSACSDLRKLQLDANDLGDLGGESMANGDA